MKRYDKRYRIMPADSYDKFFGGLNQFSISKDGKKLVFSSLYKASYNMFMMNNPFEPKTDSTNLPLTVYKKSLLEQGKNKWKEMS